MDTIPPLTHQTPIHREVVEHLAFTQGPTGQAAALVQHHDRLLDAGQSVGFAHDPSTNAVIIVRL